VNDLFILELTWSR